MRESGVGRMGRVLASALAIVVSASLAVGIAWAGEDSAGPVAEGTGAGAVADAGEGVAADAGAGDSSGGEDAGDPGGLLVVDPTPIEPEPTPEPAPQPKPPLADGVYQIGVRGAQAKRLEAASDTGGAVARIGKASSSSIAQRWKAVRGADGTYTFTNVASGRRLGVDSKKRIAAGTVKELGGRNSSVQKWTVTKNANGTFQLVNKATGKALSVAEAKSTKAGIARSSAGKRSQQLSIKSASIVPNGKYLLFSKLAQTRLAARIPDGSVAQYAQARIAKTETANFERFVLTCLDKRANLYAIQSATSGRYLADRDRKVCQRGKAKSGKLAKAQQWRVDVRNSGLLFENAGTGRVIAVAGGKARSGAALVTRKDSGIRAQRFRAQRISRTLENGMYQFTSRGGKFRLDVTGASWNSGANVQIYSPNTSIAQKFDIRYAGGGYYRISMPQARTALSAQVSGKAKTVNVRMESRRSTAAQLWKPLVTDQGIKFQNKATGTVLGTPDKVRSGLNVRVSPDRSASAQAWKLTATTMNVKEFSVLREVVNHVPGSGNRELRLDAKGTGYKISDARWHQLADALGVVWQHGADASFIMVDLDTGITLSMGPDRDNHGASTFKAAYVTYLYQNVIERGGYVDSSAQSLMWQTISYSSNEAYQALRSRYGTGGFRAWLDDVGLGHLAGAPFPRLTARNLARVWAKIYSYENSGASHVGEWRRLFDHSYYSFVREQLEGSNTVYSKPGWYPKTGNLAALNDGAIVRDRNGREYLLAVLSNTSCYTERWIMRDLVKALDAIHREMPRK